MSDEFDVTNSDEFDETNSDEFDETNMDGEIEEMGLGSETDGPVDLPLPGAGA